MEQKPRSRANSVIGQIKCWTSNHHFTNNNDPTHNNNHIKTFGSSVAVQKLRESKWFAPDESRIFCAVIECGFIVETREGQENDGWFGVVNCKTSKGKVLIAPKKKPQQRIQNLNPKISCSNNYYFFHLSLFDKRNRLFMTMNDYYRHWNSFE